MFAIGGVGGTFLGVGVAEVTAARAKELKLKEEYGVEITRIEDESPAAKAGLKVGDVAIEYNGQRVEGTEQFVRLVRETPAGRTVKLLVSRDGATQTLTPILAQRKGAMAIAGRPFKVEIPRLEGREWQVMVPDVPMATMSWRSPALGVVGEAVEGQLAAYFGVKEGVLVRGVTKGSAAEKAGVRAGDVILKVGADKVTSPREITSALRSAKGKKIPLALMRDKKELTLTVEFPEDPDEERGRVRAPRATTVKQLRL
jgi:serine protease Do